MGGSATPHQSFRKREKGGKKRGPCNTTPVNRTGRAEQKEKKKKKPHPSPDQCVDGGGDHRVNGQRDRIRMMMMHQDSDASAGTSG